MMGYWFGGFGWIGMMINLLIAVALIIGLVFLVRWIVERSGKYNSEQTRLDVAPTADEIARERYAKGEISRDEFQTILNNLGQGR